MKTVSKLLVLVFCVVICLSLFGCKKGGTPAVGGGGSQESTTPEDDYIYCAGSDIYIIYPEGDELAEEIASEFYMTMLSYTYSMIYVMSDTNVEAQEHEIVIGNTNRDISYQAYRRMERIDFDSEKETRYMAYTDGRSVALMYDEDVFDINLAATELIERFSEDYVKKNQALTLKAGVTYSGVTKPLEYQRELDNAEKTAAWAALEKELGGDAQAKKIVDALKKYYANIASERVVSWMADLYDTETGAFYYSNSGRNTEGFGPDIESTQQMFSLLSGSGMLNSIGGVSHLPDDMLDTLGKWVKSLQDPNGFFYHPQWTKEYVDSKLSRRARDLNQALVILNIAGYKPTYTVNGVNGDYTLVDGTKVNIDGTPVLSEGELTGRLMYTSATVAVSKIVPVSDTWTGAEHLKDETAFRNYLYSLDIRNNSYAIGNTLSAQAAQIKSRDQQLGGTLIPIIEKWLYDNQNPNTGTWDWTGGNTGNSNSGQGRLEGNNGVLKIVSLYNTLGIEFPRPELAIENAIAILTEDTETVHVCDTYNTWYAIDDIFENLLTFAVDEEATKAQIAEIRASLLADATNLIENTLNRLLEHKKDDGSYSYYKTHTSAESQGALVAVGQTNEGDVNATYICIVGTTNHMLSALGIENIPIFGKTEYCEFISIINDLGVIVKDPVKDAEPITFNDYSDGESASELTITQKSTGEFKVVNDPRDPNGKVYYIDSKNDGGDTVKVSVPRTVSFSNSFVFETDIMVKSGSSGIVAQIQLDSAYMLTLFINNGKLEIGDASSTAANLSANNKFGISIPLGEWFKLRVEYYKGGHDTVRAVISINDTPIAISDNYYDRYGVKLSGTGTPYSYYSFMQIICISTVNLNMMLDNILVSESKAEYNKDNYDHSSLLFDADPPLLDEIIYDFEDGALPEDFTVTGGSDSISVTDKMNISVASSAQFDLSIPENKRTAVATATVFEALMNFASSEVGAKVELALTDSSDRPIAIYRLEVVEEDGVKFVTLTEAPDGESGKTFDTVKVPADEDFKLGFEYYKKQGAVIIYLNGRAVDITKNLCTNAQNYTSSKLKVINIGTTTLVFSLDDIKLEAVKISYTEATKLSSNTNTYDFSDGMPEGVTVSGSAEITDEKALSLKAEGSYVTVPVNDRGLLANVLTAEFDIKLGAKTGESVSVSVVSIDGSTILEYVFTVSGINLNIHESTKNAVYASTAFMSALESVSIRIDYFENEGIANIYANGEPILASGLIYSEDAATLTPSSLVIKYTAGSSGVTLDNILFETNTKEYESLTVSGGDEEGTLTFDMATAGSIPKRVTSSLASTSSSVVIKEYMMKSEYSKVLAFTSASGSTDTLFFAAEGSKDDEGVTALIFSADMKFEITSGGTYEICLLDADGNRAYFMLLYETDGLFSLRDYSGISATAVPGKIDGKAKKTSFSTDEVITLKIEMYLGDRDSISYKTYMNGTLVYESSNFYGKSKTNTETEPILDVRSISVSAYGDTASTLYIDNVAFAYGTPASDDEEVVMPEIPAPPYVPPTDEELSGSDQDTTIEGDDESDTDGWV